MGRSGFLALTTCLGALYASAYRPTSRGQSAAWPLIQDRHIASASSLVEANLTDRWQLYTESTGPKLSDIKQGNLGNCYFLSSLGAVVRYYPERIKQMFVSKDLERGVYVTRFFIFGLRFEVAVNDQVPLRTAGEFAFSDPNDGDDLWPAILEKAWAKIHGSYAKVEGGLGWDAMNSITGAPADIVKDKNLIWDELKMALKNKWPTVLASAPNAKIIFPAHAYVLVDVKENYQPKNSTNPPEPAVHIYNPHAANVLNGASFQNDVGSGYFWLTKQEFLDNFMRISVARFKPGYKISAVELDTVKNRTNTARPRSFDFEVMEGKASIQLYWPSSRLFPQNCRPKGSLVFVAYKLKPDGKTIFGKAIEYSALYSHSSRIEIPGPGKYRIYIQMQYESSTFNRYTMNIYSKTFVDFTEVTNSLPWGDMFSRMSGTTRLSWIELSEDLDHHLLEHEDEPTDVQPDESSIKCTDTLINDRVDRLTKLNNVDVLEQGQDDNMFPSTMASIGTLSVMPEGWGRVKTVMEEKEENLAKIKKCVSAWPTPGQAGKCSYEAIFDCPDRQGVKVNGQAVAPFKIYTNNCNYLNLPAESFENRERLAQAACSQRVFAKDGKCQVTWINKRGWHECSLFTYSCEVSGQKQPVSFVIKSFGTFTIPVLKPDENGKCECERPQKLTMQTLEQQWLDSLKKKSDDLQKDIDMSKNKDKADEKKGIDAGGSQTHAQKKKKENELKQDIESLEKEAKDATEPGQLDNIKQEEDADKKKLDELEKEKDSDNTNSINDLEDHLDQQGGGLDGVDEDKNGIMTEEERQRLLQEEKDEIDREKKSLEDTLHHDEEQQEEEQEDERQSEDEAKDNSEIIRKAQEEEDAANNDAKQDRKEDHQGANDPKLNDDLNIRDEDGTQSNDGTANADLDKEKGSTTVHDGDEGKPGDLDKVKLEQAKAEQERLQKLQEDQKKQEELQKQRFAQMQEELKRKFQEQELKKQKAEEEKAEAEKKRKEEEEQEKQRLEQQKAEDEKRRQYEEERLQKELEEQRAEEDKRKKDEADKLKQEEVAKKQTQDLLAKALEEQEKLQKQIEELLKGRAEQEELLKKQEELDKLETEEEKQKYLDKENLDRESLTKAKEQQEEFQKKIDELTKQKEEQQKLLDQKDQEIKNEEDEANREKEKQEQEGEEKLKDVTAEEDRFKAEDENLLKEKEQKEKEEEERRKQEVEEAERKRQEQAEKEKEEAEREKEKSDEENIKKEKAEREREEAEKEKKKEEQRKQEEEEKKRQEEADTEKEKSDEENEKEDEAQTENSVKEDDHQSEPGSDEDKCFALGKVGKHCYVVNLCNARIHVQVKEVRYYYRANRVREEPLKSCDLFPHHEYAYKNYEQEINGAKCVVANKVSHDKCSLENKCVAPVDIDGHVLMAQSTVDKELHTCNEMHKDGLLKHMNITG